VCEPRRVWETTSNVCEVVRRDAAKFDIEFYFIRVRGSCGV
jgi:hypothetical protein